MIPPRYTVGLDLGQASDYTALCVAKVTPEDDHPGRPRLDVVYLKRYALGTDYPAIVADVVATMADPKMAPAGFRQPSLVIDATGVGRPVVDMFTRSPIRAEVNALTITAGDKWRREGRKYWTPKKDLVGSVQAKLMTGRLKIVAGLAHAPTLQAEMMNFKVKVTLAANETFEGWRQGDHDDLVLSVAMVSWISDRYTVLRIN